MTTTVQATGASKAQLGSTAARMLNVMACPGDVFDEVMRSPVNLANWRAPTLLVCLTGILALPLRLRLETSASAWPLAGSFVIIAAAVAGSIWSAFVLWVIARFFLGARVSFFKAIEVAGLAGVILAFGTVVTMLLIAASGNADARASLSMLLGDHAIGPATRLVLVCLDPMYLWSILVLAIGLGKLASVSLKEAGFWVFGYWVVTRLALQAIA
jgi:hypothetical protein